ncbi:hypothetical protein ACVBEF_21245 [Glaciimonas sp. GG7]
MDIVIGHSVRTAVFEVAFDLAGAATVAVAFEVVVAFDLAGAATVDVAFDVAVAFEVALDLPRHWRCHIFLPPDGSG